VVFLPYLWLLLFFVVPFLIVLKISFSDIDLAIPPYKPLLEWDRRARADDHAEFQQLRVSVHRFAVHQAPS
jgi:ABC-type spermidine/putrescine transport system permease subunit I